MIEIKQATEKDARYLAKNLRQADKDEFYKVSGSHDFYDQIMHGLNSEDSHTYALYNNGYALAIVGCIEMQDFQVVWACGTDEINKHPKSFIQAMRKLSEKHQLERKPYVNYVDCDNHNAIRFLKASGFTLLEAEPYGKLEKYFYPFIK